MNDIVISVQNVSKKYNIYRQPIHRLKEYLTFGKRSYHQDFWALKNVSFNVCRGETLGIIGKNGSGKSTLLQIICGILHPTSGGVVTHGRISAILELGSGFNPEFTGRENAFMSGQIIGLTPKEIEDRFEKIVAFADIGDFIDQPVKTYSSGMYLRLAFAIAMNVDPDILVIDEALAVGDIFFRQKCYRKLEDFRKKGVAILLVSHSMPDVEQFCKRALLLDQGNVKFEGVATRAVKKYYLIQQAAWEEELMNRPSQGASEEQDIEHFAEHQASNDNTFWPAPQALFDLSRIHEVSNGWARSTALALCNSNGESCRVFQQGERAVFFYEFELLHDLEVPIAGILIFNERNVIVHGKTTLEYDAEVPCFVKKGTRLRFRHEISLELGIGDYTFQVGLSTMKDIDYKRRSSFLYPDLASRAVRICHLSAAGSFTVTFRKEATPVQLLHHGLCNLPGSCDIRILLPEVSVSQTATAGPLIVHDSKMAIPAIVHITHWKAGSQWISKILRQCFPDAIRTLEVEEMRFFRLRIEQGYVYPASNVTRDQFDALLLPPSWRRFIVIRDLRDTLVSGYFSLKTSHPEIDPRITEWRQQLKLLDVEEGLLYLMESWLIDSARIQQSWLNSREPLIRYEDLLENDLVILEKVLLEDCRLPISKERVKEAVLANRFVNLTKGRERGQEDPSAHERKGIAGDWKNCFTHRVKSLFKGKFGQLLIETGYEKDLSW